MPDLTSNILFIPGKINGRVPVTDYLADCTLHGLRKLYGARVVDVQRCWFMYEKDRATDPHWPAGVYGKGFTLYGLLPDDHDVDRTDIVNKIKRRYFDLVIYGAMHRSMDYWGVVSAHYPPQRIVLIDGSDNTEILRGLVGKGLYFKRELVDKDAALIPITFSIPKEKISRTKSRKVRDLSPLVPLGQHQFHNFTYADEDSYYDNYRESLYACTWKKAGWDCMRHYEILACGAIPYFIGLKGCPPRTMTLFPKRLVLEAMHLGGIRPGRLAGNNLRPASGESARSRFRPPTIDHSVFDLGEYRRLREALLAYTKQHLTTEAMAQYLLGKVYEMQR